LTKVPEKNPKARHCSYLIPESHNPSAVHGESLWQPVVVIPLQDLDRSHSGISQKDPENKNAITLFMEAIR